MNQAEQNRIASGATAPRVFGLSRRLKGLLHPEIVFISTEEKKT